MTTVEERCEQVELEEHADSVVNLIKTDERIHACDISLIVHGSNGAYTQHRLSSFRGGVSPADLWGLCMAGRDTVKNMRKELRERGHYGLWLSTFFPRGDRRQRK